MVLGSIKRHLKLSRVPTFKLFLPAENKQAMLKKYGEMFFFLKVAQVIC